MVEIESNMISLHVWNPILIGDLLKFASGDVFHQTSTDYNLPQAVGQVKEEEPC